MDKIYLTKKGYKELILKRDVITKQINETIKQMGESTRRDNDLRENPEFMELRTKAMYVLPRERNLIDEKIKCAIIIEDMPEYIAFDKSQVIRGSYVQILFDNEEEVYRIVGTDEGELSEGKLSENAPLCQELIGRKVKERFEFNGFEIEILDVYL